MIEINTSALYITLSLSKLSQDSFSAMKLKTVPFEYVCHCRPYLPQHPVKSEIIGMYTISCGFMVFSQHTFRSDQEQMFVFLLEFNNLPPEVLILAGDPIRYR